ncbi:helix-turn-helix transcriptional regulator [Dorea sp. YH-dor226]|uniref:helix-turn-helix domain-containing protein n=1 Tax=Dorea sp. YH-dor226 TaxID=3151119 RepID=UPI0032420A32
MALIIELSDDDFNNRLAKRLKEYRESMHLTQKKVAEATGFSVNTVKNMESGKTTIDFAKLRTVCRYYKKTIHDYLPECPETQFEFEAYKEISDMILLISKMPPAKQEFARKFLQQLDEFNDAE